MGKRVLVAYGTRSGTTAEVAQAIGEALRAAGVEVDVRAAKEMRGVDGYDAVVLGSCVQAGRTHGQAFSFLRANRQALSHLPVAYFVVCGTMQEDTAETRKTADAFLDPWRVTAPEVRPVSVGLFGGAIRPSPQNAWYVRIALRMVKSIEGDWRDWAAIRSWTEGLRPAMGLA
jgi:menaquinone-dependent protoporphyrinogen oxidase